MALLFVSTGIHRFANRIMELMELTTDMMESEETANAEEFHEFLGIVKPLQSTNTVESQKSTNTVEFPKSTNVIQSLESTCIVKSPVSTNKNECMGFAQLIRESVSVQVAEFTNSLESTISMKSPELIEQLPESIQVVKSIQSTRTVTTPEKVESMKSVEMIEATESCLMIEQRESIEMIQSIESYKMVEPTEFVQSKEPAQFARLVEPSEFDKLQEPAESDSRMKKFSESSNEMTSISMKTFYELQALELSSTTFTLEDTVEFANLADPDFEFQNFWSQLSCAIAAPVTEEEIYGNKIFKGSKNGKTGDVSSTNSLPQHDVVSLLNDYPKKPINEGNNMKPFQSLLDLTVFLEDCDIPEVTSTPTAVEQYDAPPEVKSSYPKVVARSPDSTEDIPQLRVLPCEIVIPRCDSLCRHLLPSRPVKRRNINSENSVLKKKFRSEISEFIPLGSCKYSKSQSLPRSQCLLQTPRPEKHVRIDNEFSSFGFKKLKSEKKKKSRDRKRKRSSPNRNFKIYSPPKANFKNYVIPKIRIITPQPNRESSPKSNKENMPKRKETSTKYQEFTPKNKESSSRNRDRPINPKNEVTCSKNKECLRRNEKSGRRNEESVSINLQNSFNSLKLCQSPNHYNMKPKILPDLGPFIVEPLNRESKSLSNIKRDSIIGSRSDDNIQEIALMVESIIPSIINVVDSVKKGCIKVNIERKCLRKESKRKPTVEFSVQHTFQFIECDEEKSYLPYSLLPERNIFVDINRRYWPEFNRAKLLSLKWAHHWWTVNRTIPPAVHEPAFDWDDTVNNFEEHLKRMFYSHLRKIISEIDQAAKTSEGIELFIDEFDTSEKQCWKIILKREINPTEDEKFAVGDITILSFSTKSRHVKERWKNMTIFGYTEEVGVKVVGGRKRQKISVSIHPFDCEVKRDVFAKVQTAGNIRQHLRLFEALSILPFSPIVELLVTKKLNASAENYNDSSNPFIAECIQIHAVEVCCSGIFSRDPFVCIIDGAPGTGKTHCLVKLVQELCLKRFLAGYALKILVVAQSDTSADDISQRLIKSDESQSQRKTELNLLRYCDVEFVHPFLKKYALNDLNCILQKPNLEFDVELEKRIQEAAKNATRRHDEVPWASSSVQTNIEAAVDDPDVINDLKSKYEREILIGSADVVIISRNACYENNFLEDFTPCPSNKGVFNQFTVCIFDDANEISETDLLIPIMTRVSNLVLTGDSKNPTSLDASMSPFTGLLEKFRKVLPKNVINFKTQYRMHPKILDCLDKMNFSPNSVSESGSSSFTLKPLMIVDLSCPDETLDHTKRFERQAVFCKNAIQTIRRVKEFVNLGIGVVVGKKNQKTIVKKELTFCPDVLVEKAGNYSGLEKDVIIVCLPALLYPEKFLYTAMTRAKRTLIVCGDFSQFKGQAVIDQMVSNASRRKCFQRWDGDPVNFPFNKIMRLFLKIGEITNV